VKPVIITRAVYYLIIGLPTRTADAHAYRSWCEDCRRWL